MNHNFNPQWNDQNGPVSIEKKRKARDSFSSASVVCAVFSVITLLTLIGPIFFGGLAAVFAHLSKGLDPKPPRQARIARNVGIIMIVICVGIASAAVGFILTKYDSISDFFSDYVEMAEDLGIDANELEDMFEQYGVDLEDYGIDMNQFDTYDAAPDSNTAPETTTPGVPFDQKGGHIAPDVTPKSEPEFTVTDEPGTLL